MTRRTRRRRTRQEEAEEEEQEEEEEATDIKSNNPHLAGGEKHHERESLLGTFGATAPLKSLTRHQHHGISLATVGCLQRRTFASG